MRPASPVGVHRVCLPSPVCKVRSRLCHFFVAPEKRQIGTTAALGGDYGLKGSSGALRGKQRRKHHRNKHCGTFGVFNY